MRGWKLIKLVKTFILTVAFMLAGLLYLDAPAYGVRIKDIAEIKGVRSNQLVGYGLVVGLNGTGDSDSATFTNQSMAAMLEKMGVTVLPKDTKALQIPNSCQLCHQHENEDIDDLQRRWDELTARRLPDGSVVEASN